jgi:transposase
MSAVYDGPQVVGLDLHRRRTVMARLAASTGELLEMARFSNDQLGEQIAKAGHNPQVVLEATYGWYWAADLLTEAGAKVHLAHPLAMKRFENRRVKNDEFDAYDLADTLWMGRLPEAWIAPPEVRARRELVRYRHKLVQVRTSFKDQVHAVLAHRGISIPASDIFGAGGLELLDQLTLPEPFAVKMASARRMIDELNGEVDRFDKLIRAACAADPGYRAIQQIPGVGPVLGAVFVAEIGDVQRFPDPHKLCCWAGLTPRLRASDTKVHRGKISKQGSRLVRWAAVEAIQRVRGDNLIGRTKSRVAANRGRNLGKVAAARKLLTCVYYGLRDGHIRCLPATR